MQAVSPQGWQDLIAASALVRANRATIATCQQAAINAGKDERCTMDEWKTKLPLNNAKGLIGEFLSKVEDASYFDKITWEMESDDADDKMTWLSKDFVSYVNVGLWETYDDFIEAVGKKMTVGRSLGQPFEAAPRRRAILTPEHWRRGGLSLPKTTSNGVFP